MARFKGDITSKSMDQEVRASCPEICVLMDTNRRGAPFADQNAKEALQSSVFNSKVKLCKLYTFKNV
jgi:hypothetical protein